VAGAQGGELQWSVTVVDEDVAVAVFDPASQSVLLYPKSAGKTQVDVTASGAGGFDHFQFDFLVSTDVDQRQIPNQSLASPVLELSTNASDYSIFFLDINGALFQGSRSRILSKIVNLPDLNSGEPLVQKIWRTLAIHTFRGATLNGEMWVHDPALVINSIGFVYCDDVASAFAHLAGQAGMVARVWTLNGHVVPEVQESSKWHMYDPDEGVFYVTSNLEVAGVEEIAASPVLITNPIERHFVDRPDATPYSPEVARIYSTTQDNVVLSMYTDPVESNSSPLFLPAGGKLLLGGRWSASPVDAGTGLPVPDYANARLIVPAGWRGRIVEPLVLVGMQGNGVVEIDSIRYSIGSKELVTRLADLSKGPVPVNIDSAQSDVTLVYLINPMATRFGNMNQIDLEGVNVQGLGVKLIDDAL